MRLTDRFTVTLVLLLGALPAARGADRQLRVQTATRPAGLDGTAFNLLTWPRPADERETPYPWFNLYRKIDGRAPWPRAPLNASPLRVYTDCERIQAVIPEGSEDWNLVEETLAGGRRGLGLPGPCSIDSPGTGRDAEAARARLELLARSRWRVAVVLGLGYVDRQVTYGKTYLYELRGVDSGGRESVLATGIQIRAGLPADIAPPEDLQAIAGDRRVLLHWKEAPAASGFEVLRASSPNGTYEALNVATVTANVTQDLDGNELDLADGPRNGYVDAQEWDASGNPLLKKIGFFVFPTGPVNGKTYHYRVASLDLLGFSGTPSSAVSAIPVDTTPPAVPGEVAVIPDDVAGKIQVRWTPATRDSDGHPEGEIAGYRVFRKDDPQSPVEVQVGGLWEHPDPGTAFALAFDEDPALRPPHGEKTFWYQVECEDASGNVSSRSAPISGHLRDITPPAPPTGVTAEGSEKKIRIEWTPNSEPDIDGYEIFRSLCDGGDWPCASMSPAERKSRCEFLLEPLGYLSHANAVTYGAVYEDWSVPGESPLCYAYFIKALDHAQNRSGEMPPDPAKEAIVCERLRDKTPPKAAVITGLLAMDGAVLVEWIGPPVQDVHAYHVYRADAEGGPWTWVGGMTVAAPPAQPVELQAPYVAPDLAPCDKIPLKSNEAFSIGSYLDTRADPHRIYWYRVLGIDWDGNESTSGVPVSTFTFGTEGPAQPAIGSVTPSSQPAGLLVQWTPGYQAAKDRGFALFRSTSPVGPYVQVGSLLTSNQHLDDGIVRGVTYYYRVALLDRDGKLSPSSTAKSGKVN